MELLNKIFNMIIRILKEGSYALFLGFYVASLGGLNENLPKMELLITIGLMFLILILVNIRKRFDNKYKEFIFNNLYIIPFLIILSKITNTNEIVLYIGLFTLSILVYLKEIR